MASSSVVSTSSAIRASASWRTTPIVEGDIGYDVTSDPNENQFALTGLSDSANAVLMFEKFGISARLAYNWRDEFLSNINQGGFAQPDLRGSLRPDRPQRRL